MKLTSIRQDILMLVTLNKALVSKRTGGEDDQKGFTLIELLVVIIIIGILAAIAIPVFLNQRESAWKASVANDLKNAAIVVETYGTTNNGSYLNFPGAGDDNPAGIKVSEGNTITVTVAKNAFTIEGSNSNITGTAAAPATQYYNSYDGGLKKWGAGIGATIPTS